MKRDEFERRMENWRHTVGAGRTGSSCCASWAEMYVKARSKDGNGNDVAPPRMIISVDELDGWLVEAAVNTLIVFNERMVLRYWYVFKYPEHWMKTKLMLRRTGVRLVLARAETNLQKVLDALEKTNIIHSNLVLTNKLHAGVDPRPNLKTPMASAGLGKQKASVE